MNADLPAAVYGWTGAVAYFLASLQRNPVTTA